MTASRKNQPDRVLILCLALASILGLASTGGAREPAFGFEHEPGRLRITCDDNPLATYVYKDDQLSRPYFAQVYAPGKIQVTRHHPPVRGKDDLDHGVPGQYFHPGIWLAFSDVNGNDYWRLKARVDHVSFVE